LNFNSPFIGWKVILSISNIGGKMQKIEFVSLLPSFFSLAISIAVGMFTFKRRHVVGAWSFSLIILVEILTTIGYILELIAPGLQGKIFWDNFQWYTALIFPVTLILFTHEYLKKLKPPVIRLFSGLFIIAVLLASIISFNIFPGIGNFSPRLIISHPFSIYTYSFGFITVLAAIFTYVVTIASIAILVNELLRQNNYFRTQTIIIILGISIPVFGSVLALIGINIFPNRDISPLTFAFANLIIGYGLFRFRIFDIIPIARSMVMDYMNDPVVILDQKDVILDGNLSFEKLIGINKKSFINKSIHGFVSSTSLKEQNIKPPMDSQEEGLIYCGDNIGYFDISTKTFSNRLGVYSGRLIILHDLTRRKLDENQLLLKKDILEENATIRTLELEQLNTLLVNEVAERKKAEKEKDNYAQEMEVLFNLAIEISELNLDIDIEEFLAKRIKELNQAFFVVLSEYDAEKKVLYPKHIVIDEQSMDKVIEIIGEDPREIYLPVSDSTYQYITKEVVLYRQSLSQSFYGVIDPEVGDQIQTTFNLDQFVGVSIKSNGKLAASLVIALQKNKTVPSAKFYESLADLASVVFWRKKI
jgi:hypothetical protein